jgi:hypothetical protein
MDRDGEIEILFSFWRERERGFFHGERRMIMVLK